MSQYLLLPLAITFLAMILGLIVFSSIVLKKILNQMRILRFSIAMYLVYSAVVLALVYGYFQVYGKGLAAMIQFFGGP